MVNWVNWETDRYKALVRDWIFLSLFIDIYFFQFASIEKPRQRRHRHHKGRSTCSKSRSCLHYEEDSMGNTLDPSFSNYTEHSLGKRSKNPIPATISMPEEQNVH